MRAVLGLAGVCVLMLTPVYNPTRDGRTLYVDSVSGVDASAQANNRDRPYLTLAAAQAAASSGDLIIVRTGIYTVTAALGKNGVSWNFEPGASVSRTIALGDGTGLWSSVSNGAAYKVTGSGSFSLTVDDNTSDQSTGVILCTHANSDLYFEGLDFSLSVSQGSSINTGCLLATDGKVRLCCRDVIGTNDATGVWWQNGEVTVECRRITAAAVAVYSGAVGTPTGDLYVVAHDIVASQPIYCIGDETTAAVWIRAQTVHGTAQSVVQTGSERLYVLADKLFGPILAANAFGLLYVRAEKITAAATLLTYDASTTGWVSITDWEQTGGSDPIMSIAGGTLDLFGGLTRGTSSTGGIDLSGGTVRLHDFRIDTSSNSSGNPITKSGGTLELDGCTLLAHSTRDSIEATGAQTVTVRGVLNINRAVDSNVTISGGLVNRTDTGIVSASSINPTGLTTNRVTYYSGSALAASAFTYSTDKLSTAGTSATLEQTGDSFGATRIVVLNRAGAAGARFENDGLELVDFIFKGTGSTTRTWRYENRGGSNNLLGTPEFQIGGATAGFAPLIVADTSVAIARYSASGATTLLFQNDSSTTHGRTVLEVSTPWATSTDASRKGRAIFNVYDTAAREAMRLEASGSAPMLGFFGSTAVVKPATTGTTTGFTAGGGTTVTDASTFTGGTGATAYRISDIVLAMKQLGLLTA